MSFKNIRSAVASKLQTVSKLQKVYSYSTKDIDAFPAAVVVPSTNESDYETVTQNERNYAFTIFLIVNLKQQTTQSAEAAMDDLIDDVMNAFDRDPYLNDIDGAGTDITLDSRYTMIGVTPTPSAWTVDENLQQLIATIELRCRLSYDALS